VQKLEKWRKLIEEIMAHPGMWYQCKKKKKRKRRILAAKNVATIP
jgi:hypothetical protein